MFTFEDGTDYTGPFEKDRMVARKIDVPESVAAPETKKRRLAPKGGAAGDTAQTIEPESPKTRASNLAKKEVEQNPFKKLIDISDLIEFETNPEDVEKEVQNILLRHNTELKSWYKTYAKKVEASKTEESFAMTLRQVWRFLRDCQIAGSEASLAQFDRVYIQGKKNHFTLLGSGEASKFDFLYDVNGGNSLAKAIK